MASLAYVGGPESGVFYFIQFILLFYFINEIQKNEVKRKNLNSIGSGMRSKYTVQLVLKSGVLIANQIQKFFLK